jgi:hypothetical protein
MRKKVKVEVGVNGRGGGTGLERKGAHDNLVPSFQIMGRQFL